MQLTPVLLAAALLLAVAPAAYARPGDLDASFGEGGIVDFITPDDGNIQGGAPLAIQPDGKILVAGNDSGGTGSVILERFGPDGQRDSSFGTNGVVLTDIGEGPQTPGFALQPDGKILVAGRSVDSSNHDHDVILRYLADGRLDGSFGTGGEVVRDGPGAMAIAVQPDGRMVVGTKNDANGVYVYRLMANGAIDPSFGTNGTEQPNVGGDVTWITFQSDGDILLGGGLVVRLHPNGALDDSFGDHGAATMPEPGGLVMQAIVESDGRIVAAGRTGEPYETRVWRLMPDGSADRSFGGTGGVAISATPGSTQYNPPTNMALAVAVQSNGDVVATGMNLDGDRASKTQLETVRLTPSGQLDPSFGDGGRVLTPLAHVDNGIADSIVVQPDGNIVIGAYGPGGGTGHIVLARYEGDPPGGGPQPPPSPPTVDVSSPSSPRVRLSIAAVHGQTLRSVRRHGLVVRVKSSTAGSVRIHVRHAHKLIRVRAGHGRRVVLHPRVRHRLMVSARLRVGGKTLASASRRVRLR